MHRLSSHSKKREYIAFFLSRTPHSLHYLLRLVNLKLSQYLKPVLPFSSSTMIWFFHLLVLPFCGYTILCFCNYLVLQFSSFTILWFYHSLVLPFSGFTILGFTILWFYHSLVIHTIICFCNSVVLQFSSFTIIWFSILWFDHSLVLPFSSVTIIWFFHSLALPFSDLTFLWVVNNSSIPYLNLSMLKRRPSNSRGIQSKDKQWQLSQIVGLFNQAKPYQVIFCLGQTLNCDWVNWNRGAVDLPGRNWKGGAVLYCLSC